MATDREQLREFGFADSVVDTALKATGNSGLQSALDWIEKHPDGIDPDDKGKETIGESTENRPDEQVIPDGFKKAMKCNSCEKAFSSVELAQLHATKTGHDDFSETVAKQLTEEEKAEKLAGLKTKLEEKRVAEAEIDKEKELENERIRRKAGKENEDAKREREKKQMDKLRQEKMLEQEDARKEKERILAMIEEDRKERAAKLSRAEPVSDSSPVQLKPPTPTDSARVQLKLPDGRSFKYSMQSADTFYDLVEKIALDYSMIEDKTLLLMPGNRQLTAKDHKITLEALGMSPSATLLLQ